MSPERRRQLWRSPARTLWRKTHAHVQQMGQAMIEYVLIITLLFFAIMAILAITGPAVGSVFSNTMSNLLDLTLEPENPMSQNEFWDLVTAVASYTPDTRAMVTNTPAGNGDRDGDGLSDVDDNCATLSNNDQTDTDNDGIGDPCDPDSGVYRLDSDKDGILDNADNCPFNSNPGQQDSNGWRDGASFLNAATGKPDGDACEPPVPPPSPTPGPSPTPADKTYGYPYQDTGNQDDWETDFSTDLKGPWNAEYWDYAGSGAGKCNGGSIFNGSGEPSAAAKITRKEQEIVFPRANHDSWTDSSKGPAPGVSTDFCARFTLNATLTEGAAYKWRYRKDDGVRIYVNGQLIVDDWNWNPNLANWREVEWTVPATSDGAYKVTILHRDGSGNGLLEVYMQDNGSLADSGDCNWTASSEKSRSGSAWSDSPGAKYNNSSFCILRLRGTLDLTGSQRPFIEWWDQYDLATTDIAWVALREVDTSTWYVVPVHRGQSANLNWERQEVRLYDLKARPESNRNGGAEETLDFRGKKIEVGFIMEADASMNGDGWWIDDFRVYEKIFSMYYLGFADAVGSDNTTPLNAWVTEGGWGQTNSKKYSGNWSWTDSPSGNYGSNSDSSLQLNGLLDLAALGVIEPELAFWHSWDLAVNDSILVEVSEDEGATWSPLRGTLETATSNLNFKQTTMALNAYINKRIMIRFRINTDGSTNKDGWYLDDIQFRNRPVVTPIELDWCENANNGLQANSWVAEGTWAASGEYAHGGSAFSDSPGANYGHGTNSALTMGRSINMAGSNIPVLEFWHRWALGDGDSLNVDVSLDGGETWQSALWAFGYNDRPQYYGSGVQSDSWRVQKAWQRVVIPLSQYKAEANLRFRWRLNALSNSSVADGWYVDDICVREMTDRAISIPWKESFEGGMNNWYAGGKWASVAENAREGEQGQSAHESPNGDYELQADHVLELKGFLDLSSANASQQPTLCYWESYEIGQNNRTYTEVIEVNSSGFPVSGAAWTPVGDHAASITNVAFNRRQIDLSAYAGKYIRLRFRLQALSGSDSDPGWWLDEVSLVLRAGSSAQGGETSIPLPYIEGGDFGAPDWVREGSWSIVDESRPVGSGSILGPGLWQVEYRNAVTSSGTIQTNGTLWGSESVSEIDFWWGDCKGCAPAIVLASNDDSNKSNNWVARYRRSVYFNEPTTVKIDANHDDGYRLYIDSAVVKNTWDGSTRQTSATYDFSVGAHDILIEYVEKTGNAYLDIDFTRVSGGIVGFDPFAGEGWRTYYHAMCSNGTYVTPAFNASDPAAFAPNIDFDWGTSAPQVVLDRNLSSRALANTPGSGTAAAPLDVDNGQFMFEAEGNGTGVDTSVGGTAWRLRNSLAGFSGGGYIQARDNTGISRPTTQLANTPRMDYVLNFPAAGTYYLAVRGYQVDGDSDSIYFGLNGTLINNGIAPNSSGSTVAVSGWTGSWGWIDTQGGTSGTPAVITVPSAGNHTLNIWMREDGSAIDRIWVGNNLANSPRSQGTCTHPTGNADEWWVARYVRTVSVSDNTTVTIKIVSEDGHRLFLDGSPVQSANKWSTGQQTSTNPVTLSAGTHTLELEYRAGTNAHNIEVTYTLESPAFHSDGSETADYPHDYAASLMFEGEFLLDEGTNPSLSWWDRYDIEAGDIMYVEVSTNGGYDAPPGGATQWTTVYTRGAHTNANWTKRVVDLTSFAAASLDADTNPQKIVVRFRLVTDAADRGEGWWIDDIQLAD